MRNKIIIALTLITGIFLLIFFINKDFVKTPDTLYVNGNFITMNQDQPYAEAMLVRGGIIESIGNISRESFPDIRVVDLEGLTVIPGFIDPHTHFALSMFFYNMVDLSGFKHQSNAEVWSFFKEQVTQSSPGDWIVCKGIDPVLIRDMEVPTIGYLDSIAPNNPVILFAQSLHSYWGNSEAFAKAGVTLSTPDPNSHSYYEKDKTGHLTGLIVEQQAFRPFLEVLKSEVLTPEMLTEVADDVMQAYAKWGNTTIVSTGLTIEDAKPLLLTEHLSAESPTILGWFLEMFNMLPKRQPLPRHFIYIRHDMAHLLPKSGKTGDDFYDIIGIKHWYDGSPYIGSMYIDAPYLDTRLTNEQLMIPEKSRGDALIGQDELRAFIKTYHNQDWQIAIHTQGDAAIREVLNVFEDLEDSLDFQNGRHRLEHCLLLPIDELDRMGRMGITPSFHINHLYYYGDGLRDSIIGKSRAEKLLPIKSVQDKGIKYSLHADQPMFESHPFRLVQTAIERKTKSDSIIGNDERITLIDALKSLTIDAAWQIGKEDKLGSLEVGKYADFIVLDQNPQEMEFSELENIKCKEVYINGNKVELEL